MDVLIVLNQVREKVQGVLLEGLLRQALVALRTVACRLLLLHCGWQHEATVGVQQQGPPNRRPKLHVPRQSMPYRD
jgi:hypothetical protein